MKALITISYLVADRFDPGDYAMLHGNGGSGDVDYNTPLTDQKIPLFPNGAGVYGFGRAPFGSFPSGRAFVTGVPGFGLCPFGLFPFGQGAATIFTKVTVTECGAYKFAFGCYDKLGNIHAGTPQEVTANVHLQPDPPTGLKKKSYDKSTDILTLEAA